MMKLTNLEEVEIFSVEVAEIPIFKVRLLVGTYDTVKVLEKSIRVKLYCRNHY